MKTPDKYICQILAALLVAIVPFIIKLPFWIVLWCFLLWGYIYMATKKGWPMPGRKIRAVLTLAGFTGAILSSGRVMGGESFVALLSVMAGLKPLEISSHRDRMVTVFLAYFIVIAGLFYSESLAITVYMFISVFATTAVLIHINHPQGKTRENLRLSFTIMAQAVPLMVILFFLFPRIHGAMWGMRRDTVGTSGFSDSVSPGNISRLAQSDEIAFRAAFKDKTPDPRLLYWRGIVFEFYDGKAWSAARKGPFNPRGFSGKNPAEYIITLEPHEERWLFALDMPAFVPDMSKMMMLSDYTLFARHSISRKLRYRVKSYTSYNTGTQKGWPQRVLSLPMGASPKARALARKWAEENQNPEKIIEAAFDFYRESGFVYTLNPPLLGDDPVDDFLFKTRKGYCEHYASSFAFS